jgi:hypothetical protein
VVLNEEVLPANPAANRNWRYVAVVVLPAGVAEPRVKHFPARLLPSAPAARFAALFAVQPRWTREQMDPYLADFKVRSPCLCEISSSFVLFER